MKRVVVATGLHEEDIRPASLLSEFKRLSVIDASNYFRDASALVDIDCPACGSSVGEPSFRKNEFLYNECGDCRSLYVSPRPSRDALADYYANSTASHFRVEHFARETAQARRLHLQRAHANWVGRIVDEAGRTDARGYADIGTHSPQIFEEIKGLGLFDQLYSVDPLPALDAECEALGVDVRREALTGLGAVTAFEELESKFSPLEFLESARDMLTEGGIFCFSTRTCSGFDLQVLDGEAPYIFVPEHMNLLSVEGIKLLIERSGLQMLELSTPGQLDLELVLRAAQRDPSIRLPSFVTYLARERGPEAHADFQAFLQKHRLSSHIRVATAKPEVT